MEAGDVESAVSPRGADHLRVAGEALALVAGDGKRALVGPADAVAARKRRTVWVASDVSVKRFAAARLVRVPLGAFAAVVVVVVLVRVGFATAYFCGRVFFAMVLTATMADNR